MKKFNYKKYLPAAVVIILCIFFVVGIAWGLSSVLEMEGTMVPAVNKEGLTPCPNSAEKAVDMLCSVVSKAVKDRPAISGTDSFDIDKDSIEVRGDGLIKKTVTYIADSAEKNVEDSFGKISSDFGEDISGKLWIPNIRAADVIDYECSFIYYECPSCGETSDKELATCEKCGSTHGYNERYNDNYDITLHFGGETEPLNPNGVLLRNFRVRSEDDIKKLYEGQLDSMLELRDSQISYDDIYIFFSVDRFTNEIQKLSYCKTSDVDVVGVFTGAYTPLGKASAHFTVTESVNFVFMWPGLRLNKHELSIDKKSTDNLEAKLTCKDSASAKVRWSSSNPGIAAVDEQGYIHTAKETGDVIITASFEFMGETYSDSAKVSVKTSVEGADISQRKLTLKKGDRYALTASVSPKKATIQTVTWHLLDESVATVDSEGRVRATGKGCTKIYVLSDDGYYKASCEVTVK